VGALLAVVAGGLWRVDTFLTCYDAGERWHYLPSFGEVSVTVGMGALGVAVFIVVSKLFPVVVQEPTPRAEQAERGRVAAVGRET
jgi:Ni/Fe-hydrogenase subunit HybB-like protein